MFQSTPPHGGRRGYCSLTVPVLSFNPRPRMGGDFPDHQAQAKYLVSIHAPAWGATEKPSFRPCVF